MFICLFSLPFFLLIQKDTVEQLNEIQFFLINNFFKNFFKLRIIILLFLKYTDKKMSDDKEIADIKKLPTEQKIVHKVNNHKK